MLCETLFQIFHFSSDGSLLSAQRFFDLHVLPILFKSQCWNISRVSVDYTCQCNAEIFLRFSMSPLNSDLLCFFRATYSVQVSIMKVFKSSMDYALRNFVSIISLFFWWMSPSGVSFRHSAALIFRLLSILLKSQYRNYLRVSVDCTCKCNAEISFGFQCLH